MGKRKWFYLESQFQESSCTGFAEALLGPTESQAQIQAYASCGGYTPEEAMPKAGGSQIPSLTLSCDECIDSTEELQGPSQDDTSVQAQGHRWSKCHYLQTSTSVSRRDCFPSEVFSCPSPTFLSHGHINLNYQPKVQTLCSPGQEQNPA